MLFVIGKHSDDGYCIETFVTKADGPYDALRIYLNDSSAEIVRPPRTECKYDVNGTRYSVYLI